MKKLEQWAHHSCIQDKYTKSTTFLVTNKEHVKTEIKTNTIGECSKNMNFLGIK